MVQMNLFKNVTLEKLIDDLKNEIKTTKVRKNKIVSLRLVHGLGYLKDMSSWSGFKNTNIIDEEVNGNGIIRLPAIGRKSYYFLHKFLEDNYDIILTPKREV